MKMHLCERFKIDALGTSQGPYSKEVFSGRFEDVQRTFLLNCKNKQHLAFKYFKQQIRLVGSKIIQK